MENNTDNNINNINELRNSFKQKFENKVMESTKPEVQPNKVDMARPQMGPNVENKVVESAKPEIQPNKVDMARPQMGSNVENKAVESAKPEIQPNKVDMARPQMGPNVENKAVESAKPEIQPNKVDMVRSQVGSNVENKVVESAKPEVQPNKVDMVRSQVGSNVENKVVESAKPEVQSNKVDMEKQQVSPTPENKVVEGVKSEVQQNKQDNVKKSFEVEIENVVSRNELDSQIDKIQNKNNVYECGRVIRVTNFIVEVSGLENVAFFEKVKIGDSAIGYINSILENSVTVAILSNTKTIKVDDKVYSTGETLNAFFSNQFVGRIIDMFGNDLYAQNKFEKLTKIDIETKPIPIMDRGTVNRPLQTGISGIDLIYPIGKGQRQLIVGDKKTGKTQLCLDAIANQKEKNVLCIYVAIGKTKKEVKSIYTELQARGALSYTIVISAFNDDKPPIIYLTPYAALSIAEVFMRNKNDVLVVIDDLKRHADAYREISLVSGKTPGRDAYPADIFYTHSRLLEKGCQLSEGGSITILPVVETKGEDITDYITTNIISITDGQIYLSSKLFNKGQKPAIDYGLSVSRLGGAVQEADIKKLGAAVRLKLLNYLETQDVYQFANLDEMGGNLKNKILEGKKIMELLNQNKFSPKTKEQIINDFKFVLGATNES